MTKFKALTDKILHNDGLIYTFMRSFVSSQAGSWVDLGSRMLFFAFILQHIDPFYRSNISVAVGAILGGVVNCVLNYKFTFHADGQSVKAVVVKYAMVWVGSLLLNMYGTTFLARPLSKWHLLQSWGFTENGIFATATLFVALMVSWFWNFLLQRYFVYRPNRFDATAIRFVNLFSPKHLISKHHNSK